MNKQNNHKKVVGLILLGISTLVWLTAPFMSVNLLTYGDENQATALKILRNDVPIIGDIKETPAFSASLITLITILAAVIIILYSNKRVISGITLALGTFIYGSMIMWQYSIFEDWESLGPGVFVLLLLLVGCTINEFANSRTQQIDVHSTTQYPYRHQEPIIYPAAPKIKICAACGKQAESLQNKFCSACGKQFPDYLVTKIE